MDKEANRECITLFLRVSRLSEVNFISKRIRVTRTVLFQFTVNTHVDYLLNYITSTICSGMPYYVA